MFLTNHRALSSNPVFWAFALWAGTYMGRLVSTSTIHLAAMTLGAPPTTRQLIVFVQRRSATLRVHALGSDDRRAARQRHAA